MALFDRASLVQIPSGYKEGKLYNIKPFDQPFEFERGSAATRVNEDGLIEQAGVSNTQLWNDDDVGFVGTGSYSNGVVTMTASTGNDYVVFRSLEDVQANDYYEISFDTVVNSGSFCLLQGNGTAFSPNYLISDSGSYSRIVQYTHATSGNLFFWSGNVASLGVQFDGTISNISIKKVNIDTPRIDYTNGKALLLEPQRTNLFENSQELTGNIAASTGGLLPERDSSIQTPDGFYNADKMVRAIAETRNYSYVHETVTLVTGQSYSASCYFKAGTSFLPTLGLILFDADSGPVIESDIVFDLQNESSHVTRGQATGKIENIGNGWYRCSLENFIPQTDNTGRLLVGMAENTSSTTWVLDANNNGLYYHAFGLQLEQGSYATSYIPTNGQTETRDADVCIGGGDESTFNDSEGTIFGELNIENDINSSQAFITLSNGDINKRIVLYHNASYSFIFFIDGLGNIAQISTNNLDNRTIFKFAAKYKNGDNALFINGSKIGTTNTGNIIDFDGLSEFSFQNPNGAYKYEGLVKALAYFPEALTDTELQQLTSNT